MPYDLTIKDVETKEIREQRIEDLKQFRDILLEYKDKNIEVDLVKVKEVENNAIHNSHRR